MSDAVVKEPWQGQCYYWQLKIWIIICLVSVLALTSHGILARRQSAHSRRFNCSSPGQIKATSDKGGSVSYQGNMFWSDEEGKHCKTRNHCICFMKHCAFYSAGLQQNHCDAAARGRQLNTGYDLTRSRNAKGLWINNNSQCFNTSSDNYCIALLHGYTDVLQEPLTEEHEHFIRNLSSQTALFIDCILNTRCPLYMSAHFNLGRQPRRPS